MFAIEVHICDQRRSYNAKFSTEDQAIDFVTRKSSTCAFHEIDEIPADWNAFYELMNPKCEHGMSADLCYGPAHYATYEEIAQGW